MDKFILTYVVLFSPLFENTLWVMCRVQTQSEVPGDANKTTYQISWAFFSRAANSFLVLQKCTRFRFVVNLEKMKFMMPRFLTFDRFLACGGAYLHGSAFKKV